MKMDNHEEVRTFLGNAFREGAMPLLHTLLTKYSDDLFMLDRLADGAAMIFRKKIKQLPPPIIAEFSKRQGLDKFVFLISIFTPVYIKTVGEEELEKAMENLKPIVEEFMHIVSGGETIENSDRTELASSDSGDDRFRKDHA